MNLDQKILAEALEDGLFDYVIYEGKWKEYDIYAPAFDLEPGDFPPDIGLPFYILVQGEEMETVNDIGFEITRYFNEHEGEWEKREIWPENYVKQK